MHELPLAIDLTELFANDKGLSFTNPLFRDKLFALLDLHAANNTYPKSGIPLAALKEKLCERPVYQGWDSTFLIIGSWVSIVEAPWLDDNFARYIDSLERDYKRDGHDELGYFFSLNNRGVTTLAMAERGITARW